MPSPSLPSSSNFRPAFSDFGPPSMGFVQVCLQYSLLYCSVVNPFTYTDELIITNTYTKIHTNVFPVGYTVLDLID